MSDKNPAKKDKSTTDESDHKDLNYQKEFEKLIGLEATLQLIPVHNASKAMAKIHWGDDAAAAKKSLTDGLKKQHKLLQAGDLSGIEAMLLAQVFVLDSMFNRFVIKTMDGGPLEHFKEFNRIALKEQNQCRRNITTLTDLRSPKRSATFIKQQNVGINQQINDGQAPIDIPEKKENPANELLEENHDARLDTGKTQKTSRADTQMETVGKIKRSKNGGR